MRPGTQMSIQDVKARSFVPAVPRRASADTRGFLHRLFAWWRLPPAVPEHLREDVGLPPTERSIFDFPLIDLSRSSRRKDDWMN